MRLKTVFLILVTVIITVVLMQNTDEVNFWFFGSIYVSKLLVLGVFFLLGLITGLLLGRTRKKQKEVFDEEVPDQNPKSGLSEEDRDYIS